MEVVNEAFNAVKQFLKSTVPPLTVMVDEPEYYEVAAINDDAPNPKDRHKLLGYVTKHADSVTVGFDNHIGEDKKKELFSAYLLQKMNKEGRIRIHEMNHQLHSDLQDSINRLLRYYNDMNWYKP